MGKKLKVQRFNAATDMGAQGHVSCDHIDKSLYLDSQKKIEALTSENHKLKRKLEIAFGKPEVVVEHNGNHDAMEWTEECEKYYLEILAERVKRYPNGSPFFKATDWIEMDEQIFLKFALRYGPEKLKGKYHRLRSVHTKFGALINYTGVTWDSLSGKVFADDAVWDDFFERDKMFKTFKKRGCKLYPLLTVVFGGSCTFHDGSTAAAQTSEEEHRLEEEFIALSGLEPARSGSQKRKLAGDVDGTPETETERETGIVKKNSEIDKYEALIDALSESMLGRGWRKEYKANYNNAEVTSSMITEEEFSIKDCMGVLESTPGVSTSSYNKALEYFLEDNWRKIFLLMSQDRRKAWLDNLGN